MSTLRPSLRPATLALVLAAGLPSANSRLEGAGAFKWSPEAVVDTVLVGNVALSPDGASVVFTRTRWRPEEAKPGPAYANLWRMPYAGGEAQRLTQADGADSSPRFSPDGRAIALLSARGPEPDKARLYLLPAGGGESEALTDERLDVKGFAWSPDGKALACVAEEPKSEAREKAEKAGRDQLVVDQYLRPRRLWILDLTSRQVTRLASLGEDSAWDFGWSPDGTALVATVTERNRTDDGYMFKRIRILPRAGEARELVPVSGKLGEVKWSPDGKTIAYLAGVDASDPSLGSLFVVPAAGGAPRNLTGLREETGQSFAWLPDGRLVLTAIVGTGTGAWRVDPVSGERQVLIAPGAAAFGEPSWSRDGRRVAFAGSTAGHPAEVYVGSLPGAPERISDSNPQLAGLPRGAQETIRYRAGDGVEIEGLVIHPLGFREGLRSALVVIVHGGPESAQLDGWNNSYSAPGQLLAERGFTVFLPNYRGSTGRGVAYAKRDHRDLGGKEFEDVLDGITHLAAKGWIDPSHVGITGGSYGGYFTALAVTRHSDRFAAGVELFGITNWESFLGQSDIPIENSMVHWELSCYEQAELCRAASPLSHLARARTPTLILQGEKDLRVPKPQSDELYAALRWKRVPVEYVVYPREPHGFRERAHRLDALTRLLGWMERYLKPAGS